MKAKIGEIHQRKKFIGILEETLDMDKYTVYQDITVKDIKGEKINIPDITILKKNLIKVSDDEIHLGKNSVVCIIETKKKKKKSIEGIEQTLRYMANLECNLGFSTNFLDMVGIDTRESSPKLEYYSDGLIINYEENLRKLVNIITDVIEDRKIIKPIAKNDKIIIEILSNAVDEIFQFTKKASTKDIETAIGLFMAKHFDKSTMDEKNRIKFDKDTQKAAAYLVVNQLLFYHILSQEIKYYPELDEVRELKTISEYFAKVLEDDYSPVFGHQIIEKLPKETINAINSIIRVIKDLKLEQLKRDFLGKIFHNFIPIDIRKKIAAYYTDNAAGLLLSNLSIFDKNAKVIDIACGSGTLMVSAYERKKELYTVHTPEMHMNILKEIYGIDISVFASHLASIHLALQEPLSHTEDVNIFLGDALLIQPGKQYTFEYWSNEMIKSTRNGLVREQAKIIPKCDLVIMNPPFTQSRRMDKKYKNFLKKVIENAKWQKYLFKPKIVEKKSNRNKKTKEVKYTPGWLNLHTIFLIHAHDFLNETGRIAAVLPAQTFSADYSEGIKKFFDDFYHIEYFITSEVQNTFSVDCDWKEILFIAKRTRTPNSNDLTKFITLKKQLTLNNFREFADLIKNTENNFEDESVRINIVERKKMLRLQNWMGFCYKKELHDIVEEIQDSKNIVPGFVLFKDKINRGIEPRGAKFFFLPNKDWGKIREDDEHLIIRNNKTKEVLKIPKEILYPTLRSPIFHSSQIVPKPVHYLLSIPPGFSIRGHLNRYFKWGEYMAKDDDGYISNLYENNWESHIYAQINAKKPFGNVIMMKKFKPDSRGVYAHYINQDTTPVAIPNTFYYFMIDDEKRAKSLVGYLNSIFFLIQILLERNVLSKSSEELTEKRINGLFYLDIFSIDQKIIDEICNIVDELSDIYLPSIFEQLEKSYRKKLDIAIAKALNFSSPEKKVSEIYTFYKSRIEKIYNINKKPKFGMRF